MKRIPLLLTATFFTSLVIAQPGSDGALTQQPTMVQGKSQQKQTEAMSNRNKNEDKLDILDITGLGGSTFTTMNYPDGSSKANSHSLKITLSLLTGPNKTPGYQLMFFPANATIATAVELQNGITSINFPMSTFEVMNQKLEQSVAAKKKVQLKITQNPNGYREAVLVF